MRIAFVGTGEFAVPILEAMSAEEGTDLALVVTQPDRPAGRGRRLRPSPVKRVALAHGIDLLQPERIGEESTVEALRGYRADLFLVAAYGQILPAEVLVLPRLGCYNVHPSLLPALRGPAPINWAIIRGLERTGVTIIRMSPRVDAGQVVARREVPIGARETAGELGRRLSRLAASLVLETLPLIEAGLVRFSEQDEHLASSAPKLTPADGVIPWERSAEAVDRLVRGVTPRPGARTVLLRRSLPDKPVRLLVRRTATRRDLPPSAQAPAPGTVLGVEHDGLLVACGEDALLLERVQPAGKREMSAREFVNGYRVAPGDRCLANPGEEG